MSRIRRRAANRVTRKSHRSVSVDAPKEITQSKPNFLRFIATSLSCTLIDQLLAALLFSVLRDPLAGAGFLRILCSSVLARIVSLTLNFALNRRLVFVYDDGEAVKQRASRRESLPRFVALAIVVLSLSTLIVFAAHSLLGVAEWKAKIVADSGLFFLNYYAQRSWVFRNEAKVSVPRKRRR